MSLLDAVVAKSLPYIPKSIVGKVSKRYIAGTALEDAVRVVRDLNARGMMATLDLLGEDVHDQSEALATKDEWLRIIQTVSDRRLDSNVSLKLSQLGLRIDTALCYRIVEAIVDAARRAGNFVRIDMEDSSTTDDTLALYRRLREVGYDNVGVVIQAYLRRSEQDVRALVKMKANFRVCKGIYIEPEKIAFRDRGEIRRNFVQLVQTIIDNGCYVGIATHDEYVIEKSYELIQRNGLQNERYEFQMLLGVREALRDSIVRQGHRLRVYVPFGERWYAYSVRRLKENPQIAGYVLKAMVHRGNAQ
jgi:proline dehydrogenase